MRVGGRASFSHSLATVNSMNMNSAKTLVPLTSAVDPNPFGSCGSGYYVNTVQNIENYDSHDADKKDKTM